MENVLFFSFFISKFPVIKYIYKEAFIPNWFCEQNSRFNKILLHFGGWRVHFYMLFRLFLDFSISFGIKIFFAQLFQVFLRFFAVSFQFFLSN